MKKLIVILICFLIISCTKTNMERWNSSEGEKLRSMFEFGYFEGQKAAMEGIWYITYDEVNKTYYWTKNIYTSDSEEYLQKVNDGWNFDIQYIPPVGE